MINKILIFIPTYNERENIALLYARIKKLGLDVDILFVDDNSPDGTGQAADEFASQDPSVTVIHRPGKLGIGGAHLDGIRWAYDKGYRTLVTLDCDFTHQPEDIPSFIRHGAGHDAVIGSRYMDSKSLQDWNLFRRTMTFSAHFLTKHLLNMPQDATGAFRLYDLDRIPKEIFDRVTSKGYSFFFESLHLLILNNFSIKEVPIVMPARALGHSKMTLGDAWKGVTLLMKTYLGAKMHKERYLLPKNNRAVRKGVVSAYARNKS